MPGPERIVFVSDYGPVPYGVAEHIQNDEAVADADQTEAILWRNSQRLFKLELQ